MSNQNVNQVINRTAREPNCTIITVSIGKGFSHFLYLLTIKAAPAASRGEAHRRWRSLSKYRTPVRSVSMSKMTSINFRSGLYFFFLFLTISIILIFTPAREGLLSNGYLSGFSSHYFPKQKGGFIRSIKGGLKRI